MNESSRHLGKESTTPLRNSSGETLPGPSLSFVIIARNEESNIRQCIESVLHSLGGKPADILLVDSASTDRTVEFASQYPISILRLDPSASLSPSAGRFVGAAHAKGVLIQFLDADMTVIHGWLDVAMKAIADPSIGAVGGRRYRVFPGEKPTLNHPDTYRSGQIAFLGAAGLYRAEALRASGGFNPFMQGEEESELGHRLALAGYALFKLDAPMVYHFDKERVASEVDEKATHFIGVGQVLRAYPGAAISADVLKRQSRVLLSALLFLGAAITACLLAVFGGEIVRAALLLIAAAVLGWFALRGRLRKLLLYARFRVFLLFNIVRGFLRGIPDPSQYALHVTVLSGRGDSLDKDDD